MALKSLRICDLCASEGTLTPATAKYYLEHRWHDCCEEHAEHVQEVCARAKETVSIVQYQTVGDTELD